MATTATTSFEFNGLSQQQFLMLAIDAARSVGWYPQIINADTLLLHTTGSRRAGELITIEMANGLAIATSKNKQIQLFGKNKNAGNISRLQQAIETLLPQLTPEHLTNQFEAMVAEHQAIQTDLQERAANNQLTAVEKISMGVGGHFITYGIIAANLLVFVIMVIAGVNLMEPSTGDLLHWGGNLRAYTVAGEWYRLLTSTFLHGGILHLLFNMYALYFIGIYLEPLIGRWRFLALYLCTGILASAASIWWSGDAVSVGASGAIFGMYGVFLALLTTNYIDKDTRKALLQSIVIFVVFNLAYGTKAGIDNAAHIGGLLSGLLFGYICYFFFISSKDRPTISILATVAITALILMSSMPGIQDDSLQFEKDFNQFIALEAKAMKPLQSFSTSNAAETFTKDLQNISLPAWQQNKKLLEKANNYHLNNYMQQRKNMLQQYVNLRLRQTQLFIQFATKENLDNNEQLTTINQQINNIIDSLNK
jgi:rhomboid protease GluP